MADRDQRDHSELDAEIARLREVEKHRDWRIAELEKHVANIEALLARSSERNDELDKHSGNLEALLGQSASRTADVESHASNLEVLLARANARVDELTAHATNLEVQAQRDAARIAELSSPASLVGRQQARIAQLNRELRELGELSAERIRALRESHPDPALSDERAADRALGLYARIPPEVPGYRSRFGGLWADALDADERLASKLERGEITEADAARVREWRERGILHLPGAVSDEAIRALLVDSGSVFEGAAPNLHVEYYEGAELRVIPAEERHRDMTVKVIELHAHFESARRVAFARPVVECLELLFEDAPLAFQSLYFQFGSEQPMHQDSAYVQVRSPMEFVGVWIALEDVTPESGPLSYYPGSHRFDEWLWDGEMKAMPPGHPDHDAYLQSLHDNAAARGIEAEVFHPKKGDALVWHADLAHGGTPRLSAEATRTSLVVHYCPARVDPVYFGVGAPHSAKLEHESGGRYCYLSERGPVDPDDADAPATEPVTEPDTGRVAT